MNVDPRDDARNGLVLAVLNTTPTVDGTRRDLLLGADGAAFVERWGGEGEGSRRALVRARDAVREIVLTGALTSDLGAMLTRQVVQRPRLGVDGLTWQLDAPPESALAIRFLTEWTRLAGEHPGRLRSCANPDCSLFLLDRSNANARQWCSMSSCGNRMKARRHHRRVAGHS
jgi:predicted RNA-binding Zn ribbon-like protein